MKNKNLLRIADKLKKLSESHIRECYRLYKKREYSIQEEEKLLDKAAKADHGAQLLTRLANA